jgi:polyisoprenoid-binding protein YceI
MWLQFQSFIGTIIVAHHLSSEELRMGRIRRHWKGLLITAAAAVAVLGVAVPYVYINYIKDEAPAALTVDEPSTGSIAPSGSGSTRENVDGAWKVGSGSQAGYRIDEVLFGQDTTAVGRTDKVTGDLEIEGTEAAGGKFTVDLTSVKSDSERRDGQFRDNIMNTDQFPDATFRLAEPIDFKSVPDTGKNITAEATGNLTIHGETKKVTFDVTAQRTAGDALRVSGSIPFTFADYSLNKPGVSGITVEDEGTIEFLLALTPA